MVKANLYKKIWDVKIYYIHYSWEYTPQIILN